MYRIVFAKEAQRTLLRLPRNTAILIREKLQLLALDPYAPNSNIKKLQNRPGYRLRVGDWRIIYEIQHDVLAILVIKIAKRGEVYR
ncbi:type II toxin-antitoxin system RelE family toxin [Caldilinea sp.]|uniref:type II toxin-antitoxin system RelE family toxin n=1 Tax=Caldilinea sp. TaxID=2293560 RepID=UPI00262FBA13|nr:type II toxin-antitoxin system RelE/ParE family toxin [Caldilinea sp.]